MPGSLDISGVFSKSAAASADRPASMPNAQKQLDFADVLGERTADAYGAPTVEKFVAAAFVQPVFKQLRASSSAPPPFGPSKAERQFQSLIDAQVARRMVHKSNWPVVDRMAQDMLKKVGLAPSA